MAGEHRAYIRESAPFDRVVPRQNAYWVEGKKGAPNECGHGAWQVGVRYNYLNLNDKGINGGVLNDVTLGLNWFINPNMKFQWNYSVTNRHPPTGLSVGVIQGFGMRYAMDYQADHPPASLEGLETYTTRRLLFLYLFVCLGCTSSAGCAWNRNPRADLDTRRGRPMTADEEGHAALERDLALYSD